MTDFALLKEIVPTMRELGLTELILNGMKYTLDGTKLTSEALSSPTTETKNLLHESITSEVSGAISRNLSEKLKGVVMTRPETPTKGIEELCAELLGNQVKSDLVQNAGTISGSTSWLGAAQKGSDLAGTDTSPIDQHHITVKDTSLSCELTKLLLRGRKPKKIEILVIGVLLKAGVTVKSERLHMTEPRIIGNDHITEMCVDYGIPFSNVKKAVIAATNSFLQGKIYMHYNDNKSISVSIHSDYFDETKMILSSENVKSFGALIISLLVEVEKINAEIWNTKFDKINDKYVSNMFFQLSALNQPLVSAFKAEYIKNNESFIELCSELVDQLNMIFPNVVSFEIGIRNGKDLYIDAFITIDGWRNRKDLVPQIDSRALYSL